MLACAWRYGNVQGSLCLCLCDQDIIYVLSENQDK